MEIKKTQYDVGTGAARQLKPAKESQESPATDRDLSKLLNQERSANVEAWVRAKKSVRIEDPEKAKNFQALMMKYYGQPPSAAEEKRILEELPALERHRTMVFAVPKGDRTPVAPSKTTVNKAEQIDRMAGARLREEVMAAKSQKALRGRAKPATAKQTALTGDLFPQENSAPKGKRKRAE